MRSGDFLETKEQNVSSHIVQPRFMNPSKPLTSLSQSPRQQRPSSMSSFHHSLVSKLPVVPIGTQSQLPPSLVVSQEQLQDLLKPRSLSKGKFRPPQARGRMSSRLPLQVAHGARWGVGWAGGLYVSEMRELM